MNTVKPIHAVFPALYFTSNSEEQDNLKYTTSLEESAAVSWLLVIYLLILLPLILLFVFGFKGAFKIPKEKEGIRAIAITFAVLGIFFTPLLEIVPIVLGEMHKI